MHIAAYGFLLGHLKFAFSSAVVDQLLKEDTMGIIKLIDRIPIKSLKAKLVIGSLLVAAAVFLLYTLIMVYLLGFSYEKQPVLSAAGCAVSVVAVLVFSGVFFKMTELDSDERYIKHCALSNLWASYAGMVILLGWILHDFGFNSGHP
jgi:hypothetical protein